MKNNRSKSGFTVVEMLVIVPMVILVIGIFINVIVSMTGEVLATRASNTMSYNIQDTLDRIRQDVSISGGFLATNNITLTSPQGYNNDTTAFHNADTTNGNMLILNTYTTTNNPSDSSRNLVYASSQPNQCNSALSTKNLTLMMNVVYFIKTDVSGVNSLWRRIIAPSNYLSISCSTPWQQPTCAIGQTGSLCKTNDIKLLDNLVSGTGFQISYYTSSGSTSPIANATNVAMNDTTRQTAITTSNTIEITLNTSNTVAGRTITQTGTTRVTGQNNNITATAIPTACPSGFIIVPGSVTYGTADFCVMKYEAKADDNGDGNGDTNQTTGSNTWPANTHPISSTRKLISSAAGYPVANISQTTAITAASSANFVYGCASGCHLITETEWMTIAQNTASVPSNWSGGAVGSGYIYSGHNDGTPANGLAADSNDSNNYTGTEQAHPSNQRRTLSLTNGEVIWDFAGNVWESTSSQINGGQPTGMPVLNGYEWPVISGGAFTLNPYPSSTGINGSSNWNSTNGIGKIWGLTSDVSLRSFIRGGSWGSVDNAGVFLLHLGNTPASTSTSLGLRVAR